MAGLRAYQRQHLLVLLGLCPFSVLAGDFVGRGEEAGLGEVVRSLPPEGGRPKALPPIAEDPAGQPRAVLEPLPLSQPDPATPGARGQPSGRVDSGHAASPLDDLPGAPKEQKPPSAEPVAKDSSDLTSDLPTAPRKERGPFWVELEDIPAPAGITTQTVQKAFSLCEQLRKLAYQIGDDLDAGGKERTRLSYNTELLGKAIGELVALWPGDQEFHDTCRVTKSRTVVLEEELGRQPRNWSHIRWAFREVQKEIRMLRLVTAKRAFSEPLPVVVRTKEGKTVIVDPPQDPAVAAQEEREKKQADLEKQLQELRQQKESKRKEDRSQLKAGE